MSQQQNQDPNQPAHQMPPAGYQQFMQPNYGGMNPQQLYMWQMQQQQQQYMQQLAAQQWMLQQQQGQTASTNLQYQDPQPSQPMFPNPAPISSFPGQYAIPPQTFIPSNPAIQPNNQSQIQVTSLQAKVNSLTQDIESKDQTIEEQTEEINKLNKDIKKLKGEVEKKEEEANNTHQKLSDIQIISQTQYNQIEQLKKQIQKFQNDIANKDKQIQNQTQELEQIETDKQNQINQMKQEFRKQLQLPTQQQVDPQVGILQGENKKLRNENQILRQQNQQYEAQMKGMSTQEQLDELQQKVDQEHKNFNEARDEILKIKRQSDQKINQQDSQISSLTTQILNLNNEIKGLNLKLKDSNTSIESLKGQLTTEILNNQVLQTELNKPQIDRSHIIQIQEAQERVRQAMREQLIEQEKQNKEKQEKHRREQEERLKKLSEQKQRDALGRRKKNQELLGNQIGRAAQNLGTLDVCYIVDSTKSMEPYIKQTRDCIRQSSQLIKQLTNRDTNWSTICYYDIEQKPANGLYLQHDFTKNLGDIEVFLDGIKTAGGSDIPEDVEGALLQMLSNLKWSARFKIALLITDAPCHGNKYHAINIRDNHPNQDIEHAIGKLIDQNIIFIGLNFKKETTQMYQEIKKIYEAKQKQDIFSYVDMNNVPMEKIGAQMAKCIGDASENATGTNNNSTKSKRIQQARLQAKDGAMEALCKQGNFYNFEKQDDVKCVQTKFKVLKIEITQEAFENNLTEIHNIGTLQSDYRVTEEGEWNCIRTDKPFAFGMMKDVFLMKKNGAPDELYVIKTPLGSEPYNTQEAAISECRSHLLCQQLMNKFQRDIEEAIQSKKLFNQYPKVVYSSFLILKESETKYWIAERFFKGEFVKYNNNFGYMNDSEDQLNKFAQAFSLYTLYISGARYIVNDVQGVGIYFTDPAINTLEGNFDETDMGEDGIGMFLVNYQSKRGLTKEIEDLLDIKQI